jgi:hypothetical protein
MRVPTIQRNDVRFKNGGHGAKSAFAHPTACRHGKDHRKRQFQHFIALRL